MSDTRAPCPVVRRTATPAASRTRWLNEGKLEMPNEYDFYVWAIIFVGLVVATVAKFARDEWF